MSALSPISNSPALNLKPLPVAATAKPNDLVKYLSEHLPAKLTKITDQERIKEYYFERLTGSTEDSNDPIHKWISSKILGAAEGIPNEQKAAKKTRLDHDILVKQVGMDNALALLALSYQMAYKLNVSGFTSERENAVLFFKKQLNLLSEKHLTDRQNVDPDHLTFDEKKIPDRDAFLQSIKKISCNWRNVLTNAIKTIAFGALLYSGYQFSKLIGTAFTGSKEITKVNPSIDPTITVPPVSTVLKPEAAQPLPNIHGMRFPTLGCNNVLEICMDKAPTAAYRENMIEKDLQEILDQPISASATLAKLIKHRLSLENVPGLIDKVLDNPLSTEAQITKALRLLDLLESNEARKLKKGYVNFSSEVINLASNLELDFRIQSSLPKFPKFDQDDPAAQALDIATLASLSQAADILENFRQISGSTIKAFQRDSDNKFVLKAYNKIGTTDQKISAKGVLKLLDHVLKSGTVEEINIITKLTQRWLTENHAMESYADHCEAGVAVFKELLKMGSVHHQDAIGVIEKLIAIDNSSSRKAALELLTVFNEKGLLADVAVLAQQAIRKSVLANDFAYNHEIKKDLPKHQKQAQEALIQKGREAHFQIGRLQLALIEKGYFESVGDVVLKWQDKFKDKDLKIAIEKKEYPLVIAITEQWLAKIEKAKSLTPKQAAALVSAAAHWAKDSAQEIHDTGNHVLTRMVLLQHGFEAAKETLLQGPLSKDAAPSVSDFKLLAAVAEYRGKILESQAALAEYHGRIDDFVVDTHLLAPRRVQGWIQKGNNDQCTAFVEALEACIKNHINLMDTVVYHAGHQLVESLDKGWVWDSEVPFKYQLGRRLFITWAQNGHWDPRLEAVALKAIKTNNSDYMADGLNLFIAAAKKNKSPTKALETANELMNHGNYGIRQRAIILFGYLTLKGSLVTEADFKLRINELKQTYPQEVCDMLTTILSTPQNTPNSVWLKIYAQELSKEWSEQKNNWFWNQKQLEYAKLLNQALADSESKVPKEC